MRDREPILIINPDPKAMSQNKNTVIIPCSFQTQSSISGSVFHPGPGRETGGLGWEWPCPQDPRAPAHLCPGSTILHPNMPVLSYSQFWTIHRFKGQRIDKSFFSLKFKIMLRGHTVADNKSRKEIRNFLSDAELREEVIGNICCFFLDDFPCSKVSRYNWTLNYFRRMSLIYIGHISHQVLIISNYSTGK